MEANNFLTKATIPIRISCISSSGWPITISLWYVYLEEKLFCATPKNAKIVEYLRNNPKCGFEVAGDLPPYRGVRGWGNTKVDEGRGMEILRILINKYIKDENSQLANFLLKRSKNEMAIEINPLSMFHYDYSDRMKGIAINTNL